jgi:hypothetical protein
VIVAGTGAVNGVLLASAVVPPIVVIFVCRVAWMWAKSHDEEQRQVAIGELLRRALWLPPRRAGRS